MGIFEDVGSSIGNFFGGIIASGSQVSSDVTYGLQPTTRSGQQYITTGVNPSQEYSGSNSRNVISRGATVVAQTITPGSSSPALSRDTMMSTYNAPIIKGNENVVSGINSTIGVLASPLVRAYEIGGLVGAAIYKAGSDYGQRANERLLQAPQEPQRIQSQPLRIDFPLIPAVGASAGGRDVLTPEQFYATGQSSSQGKTAGADFANVQVRPLAQQDLSTFYVPYGEREQIRVENAKALIDRQTGELGIYQVLYNPDTGQRRNIMNLASSGGRASLQSGMFSEGAALTPNVVEQATAKYIGTPNLDIVKNPEKYSRLGAEAYGGYVSPLDERKVTPDTQLSRYPIESGNLANLVNPQGVNLSKAEAPGAKIPWEISITSPTIQYMDQTGIIGPAPRMVGGKYELSPVTMGGTPGASIKGTTGIVPGANFDFGLIPPASAAEGRQVLREENFFATGSAAQTPLRSSPSAEPTKNLNDLTPKDVMFDPFTGGLLGQLAFGKKAPDVIKGALASGVDYITGTIGWTPMADRMRETDTSLTQFRQEKTSLETQIATKEEFGVKTFGTAPGGAIKIDTTNPQAVAFAQEYIGLKEKYGTLMEQSKEKGIVRKDYRSGQFIENPDLVYDYGEFSKWGIGAGATVRSKLGFTQEQLEIYGMQVESRKGIETIPEKIVYGTGYTFSTRPEKIVSAYIGGAALVFGGEVIAGVAEGTGILASAGRIALAHPLVATASRAAVPAVFAGLATFSVTEGFTASPEKTTINIGKGFPEAAGMMYGGASAYFGLRMIDRGYFGYQTREIRIDEPDLLPAREAVRKEKIPTSAGTARSPITIDLTNAPMPKEMESSGVRVTGRKVVPTSLTPIDLTNYPIPKELEAPRANVRTPQVREPLLSRTIDLSNVDLTSLKPGELTILEARKVPFAPEKIQYDLRQPKTEFKPFFEGTEPGAGKGGQLLTIQKEPVPVIDLRQVIDITRLKDVPLAADQMSISNYATEPIKTGRYGGWQKTVIEAEKQREIMTTRRRGGSSIPTGSQYSEMFKDLKVNEPKYNYATTAIGMPVTELGTIPARPEGAVKTRAEPLKVGSPTINEPINQRLLRAISPRDMGYGEFGPAQSPWRDVVMASFEMEPTRATLNKHLMMQNPYKAVDVYALRGTRAGTIVHPGESVRDISISATGINIINLTGQTPESRLGISPISGRATAGITRQSQRSIVETIPAIDQPRIQAPERQLRMSDKIIQILEPLKTPVPERTFRPITPIILMPPEQQPVPEREYKPLKTTPLIIIPWLPGLGGGQLTEQLRMKSYFKFTEYLSFGNPLATARITGSGTIDLRRLRFR